MTRPEDIHGDGHHVVICPGCSQQRWGGIGSCSSCGHPSPCAPTDPAEQLLRDIFTNPKENSDV